MAKKLSSVLGIDIGSQRIKVCEVRTQGREPVVTAVGITDTPEGAVDHTGVYNPDAVAAALKGLLAASGASAPFAVVSIAGQASVLVRTLEVPRMNPTELREHMQWEINRNIPFAESTVVSDFRALPDEDPNSPNMDVVMAIAPQSAIDTMIECVKKAGRTPAAIDVEPLGMARSLRASYSDMIDGGQTMCLVDMGHKSTSINIYRGTKLLMPRQIPVGGEMFTKAIADALTLSTAEAEALKRERCEVPESAAATMGVPDPFGGAPGATQEFQPYNPFTDDAAGFVPAPTDPNIAYSTDASAAYPTDPTAYPTDPSYPAAGPGSPFAGDVPPAYATDSSPFPTGYPEDTPATPVPDAGLTPEPVVPDAGAYLPAPTGATDAEVMQLFNAISAVLDEFLAEVRRSIDYFRSRGGEIHRVVLLGGGTKLRGLAPFLAASLGIEVDLYDPLRGLNVNAKKAPAGFIDEHRQELTIAVGNGLHIFYE